MLTWLVVFAITFTIETPIYLAGLRGIVPARRGVLVSLSLNLATHPIVWFVLSRAFSSQLHYVLVAESFAITVEGVLLAAACRWLKWPARSWLYFMGLAYLANLASAGLGEIAYYLLDRWGVALF